MKVLVIGANGQLGRAVVSALAADGFEVTGLARQPQHPPTTAEVAWALADATDRHAVSTAAAGHDAIVNAVGSGTIRRNTIESSTTSVVLKAAQAAGVPRYVGVSAGMVVPTSFVFDHIIRATILRNLYHEHLRVEHLIRESALDWTIVRPSKLVNSAPRGYQTATQDRPAHAPILTSRSDVADFIADELRHHRHPHQAVFVTTRPRNKRRPGNG